MIDLLIGLAIDNADVILDFFIGAATVAVAYKVVDVITSDNVKEFIRNAIKTSKQKALKKMIDKQIEAIVKEKKKDAITLEVFCAECGEEKPRITLESTRGIDDSLVEGDKIVMTV